MKKRFTEEQIVKILQEQQTGKLIKEICRERGISENTFYIWKRKYGNMSISEVSKLKSLEYENTKLKRLVADLSLENMVQKDVIKNYCGPK
jgi:putative transposase